MKNNKSVGCNKVSSIVNENLILDSGRNNPTSKYCFSQSKFYESERDLRQF